MTENARTCTYAIDMAGGLRSTDVLELNRQLRRTLHTVERGRYATALEAVRARNRN